jgi:hypothetical protein
VARRRGFFQRIADSLAGAFDALTGFFGTPEETPEEPPRRPPDFFPPEPPPERPPPEPPSERDELRIWRNRAVGRDKQDMDDFRDWLDLYNNSVEALDMDRADFLAYWDEFLRAYYLTRGERGSISRTRFHQDIGVRSRDWEMDWDEWRERKRGTP